MRRGVRLGVDVGSVRVGLAACDPDGVIASPVRTLTRDTDGHQDAAEIAAEVRARSAVEVVVGWPLSLDGTEGPAAVGARDYAQRLRHSVGQVPVRLVDERLSTVDAHRALHASGKKEKQFRAVVDQAAAVVLLQAALDTERATGRAPGQLVEEPSGRRKPRHRGRVNATTVAPADQVNADATEGSPGS